MRSGQSSSATPFTPAYRQAGPVAGLPRHEDYSFSVLSHLTPQYTNGVSMIDIAHLISQ
jgi:hypothetical protein